MEHVVFINFPATGHMNPTLPPGGFMQIQVTPLVTELVAREIPVSYFVHETVREVVEATGAQWHALLDPQCSASGPAEEQLQKYVPDQTPKEDYAFPLSSLVFSASEAPALIAQLRTLKPLPSVIVYDPFLPLGLLAARELGIPAVATVTMAGPGVVEVHPPVQQKWESNAVSRRARQEIKELYNFDVFAHGSFLEFYSPDQNIECVGPLLNPKILRLSNAELTHSAAPMLPREVDAARAAGRRILYVSAGTVATGRLWNEKFGPKGLSNGLSECTGKELIQLLYRTVFEAFGGAEDVLLVVSTAREDALEGLDLPNNLVARPSLPQLELLPKCHAFITHGGANSMHEALTFGVPMVVVPIFGDQPSNADAVRRAWCGAGDFRHPLQSLTSQALLEAVQQLELPGVREALKDMQRDLQAAGGVTKAMDLVLAAKRRNTLEEAPLGGA
ncbi:unnamed protein product [Durusdinium trenchii]|uniref:Glycosyltransferase n=1 Tax=Durusdinium trenchii TaxID=1381693 RepID=A0ABP0HIA8_9DINO